MSQKGPFGYGVAAEYHFKDGRVLKAGGSVEWARIQYTGTAEEGYEINYILNPPENYQWGGAVMTFDHWIFPNEDAREVGLVENKKGYQISDIYQEVGTDGTIWAVFVEGGGEDPEETKFKIVARVVPSLGGRATIDGSNVGSKEYDAGERCEIAAEERDGWKFLYWESSSGEKVYTKSHAFNVSKNEVWIAWVEERKDTKLIVHRQDGAGMVYHTDDKILRDEHTNGEG